MFSQLFYIWLFCLISLSFFSPVCLNPIGLSYLNLTHCRNFLHQTPSTALNQDDSYTLRQLFFPERSRQRDKKFITYESYQNLIGLIYNRRRLPLIQYSMLLPHRMNGTRHGNLHSTFLKNKANDAFMGTLRLSTFLSTFSTPSTFSNVNVGLPR